MNKKEELRKYYLDLRENMDRDTVIKASEEIKEKILEMEEVKRAKNIMVYYSYRNEVNTHQLIENLIHIDKEVYTPYCLVEKNEMRISPVKNIKDDLVSGAYGIKEPRVKENTPADILDLVLVPAVVFSRDGFRIGYGGGYYDRFLAKISEKTITIGLTFDFLLVDSLPVESYDLPVDIIVTDKEVLYIRG